MIAQEDLDVRNAKSSWPAKVIGAMSNANYTNQTELLVSPNITENQQVSSCLYMLLSVITKRMYAYPAAKTFFTRETVLFVIRLLYISSKNCYWFRTVGYLKNEEK